jgi:hypothetical protein
MPVPEGGVFGRQSEQQAFYFKVLEKGRIDYERSKSQSQNKKNLHKVYESIG